VTLDAISARLAQFNSVAHCVKVNKLRRRRSTRIISAGMESAHTQRSGGEGCLFAPSIALLLLALPALNGQKFDPVPGFLQDLSGQFPLPAEFSFEQQIQIGTQGNSTDSNPFAYGHALQFRPWLHYDRIPNTTLTGSVSYIYYFSVPATSYYRHPNGVTH
jgi:hypothetical protein